MIEKEKFQAVFTWKLKKPKFIVGKNTISEEKLNDNVPNCSQQKTESPQ